MLQRTFPVVPGNPFPFFCCIQPLFLGENDILDQRICRYFLVASVASVGHTGHTSAHSSLGSEFEDTIVPVQAKSQTNSIQSLRVSLCRPSFAILKNSKNSYKNCNWADLISWTPVILVAENTLWSSAALHGEIGVVGLCLDNAICSGWTTLSKSKQYKEGKKKKPSTFY